MNGHMKVISASRPGTNYEHALQRATLAPWMVRTYNCHGPTLVFCCFAKAIKNIEIVAAEESSSHSSLPPLLAFLTSPPAIDSGDDMNAPHRYRTDRQDIPLPTTQEEICVEHTGQQPLANFADAICRDARAAMTTDVTSTTVIYYNHQWGQRSPPSHPFPTPNLVNPPQARRAYLAFSTL